MERKEIVLLGLVAVAAYLLGRHHKASTAVATTPTLVTPAVAVTTPTGAATVAPAPMTLDSLNGSSAATTATTGVTTASLDGLKGVH